jgi:hypothetical protein
MYRIYTKSISKTRPRNEKTMYLDSVVANSIVVKLKINRMPTRINKMLKNNVNGLD